MALQFMDGFDAYDYSTSGNTDFDSIWIITNASVAQQAGRYSGYSITIGQPFGNGGYALRPIVSETTVIVGVALNNNGRGQSIAFTDAVGNCIAYVNFNGASSLLSVGGAGFNFPSGAASVGSVPFSAPANIYFYAELELVQSTTAGSATLRINGNQVAAVTGVNTTLSGVGSLANIGLSTNAGYDKSVFDDLYVLDSTGTINNTFLAPPNGDVRVATFFPTGPGAATQLSPVGATANWQCVNEQAPNYDTNYVEGATAGLQDLYAFAPGLPTSNTVFAVSVKTSARKDDSNVRSVASLLSSSSTIAIGATNYLGSAYAAYFDFYETDPHTGTSWTASAVNALQAGVKVIS